MINEPIVVVLGTKLLVYSGAKVPEIISQPLVGYPLQWLFPISGTIVNPFLTGLASSINVYSVDVLGAYPAGTSSVPE